MSTPYPGDTYWPSHFQKATITGKFVDLAGNPVSGTINFVPSPARLVLIDDQVTVMPHTLSVTLEADGSFSLDVPATDDPNVSPARWTYTVTEVFDNLSGQTYPISAPVGTTVDLSAAAPVSQSGGVYRYVGPKGDKGDTGDQGIQGIPGTADLGPVTLDNTGIVAGKVPTASAPTTGDWEYPLGIQLSGTPGPAMWLRSTDSSHASWSAQDAYGKTLFTASGSYTSPVGTRALWLVLDGAGGGGGGGARGGPGDLPAGGGGGGGGGRTALLIQASEFAARGTDNGDGTFTFAVAIGAGGAGGLGATVDSSPGANGTDGGMSVFGSGIYAITASQGLAGSGGTIGPAGAAGGVGGRGTIDGGSGEASVNVGTALVAARLTGGPSGGGAGGSINSGLSGFSNGGNANLSAIGLARTPAGVGGTPAGTTAGTAGVTAVNFLPGQGGGGGAPSVTLRAGGAGGAGGSGGAGGGGGGAAANGQVPGVGGAGADGRAIVTALF